VLLFLKTLYQPCNCPSKINLFRRFTILHNVSLWELSLSFIGFLWIYHYFKLEDTFILVLNNLLCCMAKKHVIAILKPTKLEGCQFCPILLLGIQCMCHRTSLHLSLFSIWSHMHVASKCSIMLYSKESHNYHTKTNLGRRFPILHNVPLGTESVSHRISVHLLLFSIWSHIYFDSKCSTMLYIKEACNCHSKINIVRRFTRKHNVPFQELVSVSQDFSSFLTIFNLKLHSIWIIILYFCSMAKKHITVIPKPTH
jgi:hypothetical protein